VATNSSSSLAGIISSKIQNPESTNSPRRVPFLDEVAAAGFAVQGRAFDAQQAGRLALVQPLANGLA